MEFNQKFLLEEEEESSISSVFEQELKNKFPPINNKVVNFKDLDTNKPRMCKNSFFCTCKFCQKSVNKVENQ